MFKNNLSVVFAVMLASAASSSIAQNSSSGQAPITLGEATAHNTEMRRAKWAADLDEMRRKSGGNAPAQIAKTCDEDLSMYAVYGPSSRLKADFGYRGATITLSAGDKREIGGWSVEELSTTRAVTVKKEKGKVVARCPVYLSTIAQPFTPSSVSTSNTATANVSVPPIAPAPTQATPAAWNATGAKK